jgi:hypothetical protein
MITPTLIIVILVLAVLFIWGFIILLRDLAFPRGTSLTARLAALGVTLVLWSGAIRTTLEVLFDVVQLTVSSFHPAPSLGRGIPGQFVPILLQTLGRIPAYQLLLALVTLPLLAQVFHAFSVGEKPEWFKALKNIDQSIWLNALVFTVFFVGIYLSVASLCTIPTLQVNESFSETERTQIATQIDTYKTPVDAFNKQFPEILPLHSDELSDLRSLVNAIKPNNKIIPSCEGKAATLPKSTTISAMSESISAPATPDPRIAELAKNPTKLDEIAEFVKSYDDDRCETLDGYRNMRAKVQEIEQTEADKVKNEISSNIALRLNGLERAEYTYRVKANYQDIVSKSQAALSACKSEVLGSNPGWSSWGRFLAGSVDAAHIPAGGNTDSQSITKAIDLLRGANSLEISCSLEALPELEGRAVTREPQLGVFTVLFGWLEHSDSLPLAVICGMLGVGLVGSIVSSFVRQRDARLANDPWIADTFPVIVRGFTAAIVVYLAIEGGLNIFSTTSNQANPYVLLFACLVGAVFSEDVWVAARKHLESASSKTTSDGQKREAPKNTPGGQKTLATHDKETSANPENSEKGHEEANVPKTPHTPNTYEAKHETPEE